MSELIKIGERIKPPNGALLPWWLGFEYEGLEDGVTYEVFVKPKPKYTPERGDRFEIASLSATYVRPVDDVGLAESSPHHFWAWYETASMMVRVPWDREFRKVN